MRNLCASDLEQHYPDLLHPAATQEDISPAVYCRRLRTDLWGGQPEAHDLARSLHICIQAWTPSGSQLYCRGSGATTVHLGLWESHYVLLADRPWRPSHGREDRSSRGGARSAKAKKEKKKGSRKSGGSRSTPAR